MSSDTLISKYLPLLSLLIPLPACARPASPLSAERFGYACGSSVLHAQIVVLVATDFAATLHGDLGDLRAVGLEHALDAFAMRSLAQSGRGVQAAVALGDDHAFEGLQTFAVAFLDLDLDLNRVARIESREIGRAHV